MAALFSLINALGNPYFPVAAVYPALYALDAATEGPERVVLAAHVTLPLTGTASLLMVTTERVVVYQVGDGLWKRAFKGAASYGFGKLKDELIGQIPFVSEMSEIYGKYQELKERHEAWTGVERDAAFEKRMEAFGDAFRIAEEDLLANTPGWTVVHEAPLGTLVGRLESFGILGTTLTLDLAKDDDEDAPQGWSLNLPYDVSQDLYAAILVQLGDRLEAAGFYVDAFGDHLVVSREAPAEDSDIPAIVARDLLGLLHPLAPLVEPDPAVRDLATRGSDSPDVAAFVLRRFEDLFPPDLVFTFTEKKWLVMTETHELSVRNVDVFGGADLDDADRRAFLAGKLAGTELDGSRPLVAHLANGLIRADQDPFDSEYTRGGFVFTDTGFLKWRGDDRAAVRYAALTDGDAYHAFRWESEVPGLPVAPTYMDLDQPNRGFVIGDDIVADYFATSIDDLLHATALQTLNAGAAAEIADLTAIWDDEVLAEAASRDFAAEVESGFTDPLSTDALTVQLLRITPADGVAATWVWWVTGDLEELVLNGETTSRRQAWEAALVALQAEEPTVDRLAALSFARRTLLPLL